MLIFKFHYFIITPQSVIHTLITIFNLARAPSRSIAFDPAASLSAAYGLQLYQLSGVPADRARVVLRDRVENAEPTVVGRKLCILWVVGRPVPFPDLLLNNLLPLP